MVAANLGARAGIEGQAIFGRSGRRRQGEDDMQAIRTHIMYAISASTLAIAGNFAARTGDLRSLSAQVGL